MNIITNFSTIMAKMSGINKTYISLVIYTTLTIITIYIVTKILIFINTKLNKNEKSLYIINKRIKIIRIILIILGIILIWETQLQNIITFISFIGAAATLALRDIIVNFFAGIYISIYKPFKIEDRIEINDITGDVVNINSLNFELLEVNNKENNNQSTGIIIEIPNSKIFTEPVKNYTKAFKYIWNELEVKIKLNSDLAKNKKLLYDIVKSNDIVKRIPKKMKEQLNEVVRDYRIYYNNLDPIIYTTVTEDYVLLTIRYLAHPKKSRFIESQIWNKIYENAKENNLDLYTTETIINKKDSSN